MTHQLNVSTKERRWPVMFAWILILTTIPSVSLAQSSSKAATSDEKAKPAQPDTDDKERGLNDAWEEFRPPGMEAAVEMPKKPKLRERSFSPVAGEPPIKVRLFSSVVQDGEIMFVAGWHDLHTIPRNTRQQNDILEGAIATSVANVLGSVIEKKTIRINRYPGREVSYRFSAGKVLYRAVERVYLVGARQFQFRMLAKIDEYDGIAADRFFDSVKLLDPDNDLPPRPRNRKPKQG